MTINGKGSFVFIVLFFCLLLQGTSVLSLFYQDDIGRCDDPIDYSELREFIDGRMVGYSSGVTGSKDNGVVTLKASVTGKNLLINNYDGYSIEIPPEWQMDDNEYEYVVHLRDDSMKLTIFKHGYNLTSVGINNYLSYSYVNVRKDYGPITHISDDIMVIGDIEFRTVTFTRDEISTIDNDMNFYRHYHHVNGNRSVFTFSMKTNEKNWNSSVIQLESSLESFDFWEVEPGSDTSPVPEREVHGIELAGSKTELIIPDEKKVFGIFHKMHDEYWSEISDLQRELDFEFHFVMDYFNFKMTFHRAEEYIHKHYREGNLMLITLQPYTSSHGEDYDGNVVLMDVLNGAYDQFLYDWAKGLRDLDEPVFLRFGNEMNGDWAQWCSWFYGLDPDLFVMAWIRVHSIFDFAGAENVIFVWNPNDRTYPDYDWQAPCLYYPGDDMVDWIGITAYNNGVTRPTEFWREFEECYSDLYDDYMRRFSSKPFMITEFACNEIGGDKAEWIRTGLKSLFEDYPNIWMAVWWNGVDETWIYDIDSSESSLKAFKEALEHPAVLKDPVKRET
ncbi:MAG: glycoside hydrolase family 26 protein [Thermoplasmatota archaeon]